MSVWYYEPFYDFDRFLDELSTPRQAISGPTSSDLARRGDSGGQGAIRPLKPRMDLHEDKDKNIVTASFELPGLKKDDVDISVDNNRLTVSGEASMSDEYDDKGYAVKERRYGKFSRTLQLPPGIQEKQINAKMDNGLLTVTFPKTGAEKETKKITIK